MEKLLNTRQAAELLDCHINTVWNYIHGGKLKASKLGGNGNSKRRWRIKESDLKSFIDGQGAESNHTEARI